MELKLAYKTYSFGEPLGSTKAFTDDTGLCLQVVLQDYIIAYADNAALDELRKVSAMSKVYSREIACRAFHAIIDDSMGIPFEEIEDATHRTSWFQENRIDGFSEAWPIVLANAALDINEYIKKNIHVKKKGT